jgi:signal transduction histidine kinase
MPITIFAMLVFGICALLGAGLVEVVMRNFAAEAGVPTWVFIIAPATLSMLFALLLYRNAVRDVSGVRQSLSRAFLVAALTWLVLGVYISALWCPAYRALGCARDVAIVLTAVGGGPLLLAAFIAGTIVGIVLKRRVDWLTYKGAACKPVE